MRNFLATLSPYKHTPIFTCGVCAFACAFACVFVREFVFLQHLSFTGESRALGNNPATKNHEQIESDFFILHFSSSDSCIKYCKAIETGDYVYEQSSRVLLRG